MRGDFGPEDFVTAINGGRYSTRMLEPANERVKPNGKQLDTISASRLAAMDLPPVKYIVEGYIAEGLTVLAGRPKVGKSWMALGLAIAVASPSGCVALPFSPFTTRGRCRQMIPLTQSAGRPA
jgi:AAA domain